MDLNPADSIESPEVYRGATALHLDTRADTYHVTGH